MSITQDLKGVASYMGIHAGLCALNSCVFKIATPKLAVMYSVSSTVFKFVGSELGGGFPRKTLNKTRKRTGCKILRI